MKFEPAEQGRTFVIRLEDGDIIHEELERFARGQDIRAAFVLVVGGADAGSRLIVGPEDGRASPVAPMSTELDAPHEITGTGTIFPDDTGQPVLHMHVACGRKDRTVTGCVRAGVKVWQVAEAVLVELTGTRAARRPDVSTGFKLLKIGAGSGGASTGE
jgi:predicted DNA-binding protein with PD1-like motif